MAEVVWGVIQYLGCLFVGWIFDMTLIQLCVGIMLGIFLRKEKEYRKARSAAFKKTVEEEKA